MSNTNDWFWGKVKIGASDECWTCRGFVDKFGYVRLMRDGKNLKAHRLAYLLSGKGDPAGLTVHHTCGNRGCVNPEHLETMTSREHTRLHRGDVCNRGHPREGENIYWRLRDGRWWVRECVACRRLASGYGPKKPRYWNRERVIGAIQRWTEEHGRPPGARDWNQGQSVRGPEFPSLSVVYGPHGHFEKWADAIQAAGFERPKVGRPRS